MKLEILIEELQEIVETSKTMPLTGKKVINAEQLLEVIDEMRTNIPNEVKQAKIIAADSSNIIQKSKQEAERIVQQAEDRAKSMVERHEITRQAQQRAAEILASAESDAAKIKQAANNYIENVLKKADDQLSANLAELKKTRQSIKNFQLKTPAQKKLPPRK